MTTRHNSGWRCLVLLLCTLLSSLPAFALKLASAEPECGMSCCKRKKNPQCCKRHLHAGSQKQGPQLKTTGACAQGCAAVPVQSATLLAIARPSVAWSQKVLRYIAGAPHTLAEASSYNPRLHQRPPPKI